MTEVHIVAAHFCDDTSFGLAKYALIGQNAIWNGHLGFDINRYMT